jgi:SAM-dependent methyltransferase
LSWQQTYMTRFYRSRPGWTDGTTEFHELCRSAIPPHGKILEIGAGPSNPTSEFLATCGELHGLDPDPAVKGNAALVSAQLFRGSAFPWPNDTFDACVSNYVIEHVEDPRKHFQEVARVLRAGGTYVFRTPNRFHYVAVVAAATPHWFHELVANRLRQLPKGVHDPYPTYHRVNTRRSIRAVAKEAGLEPVELRMVEKEPSYGMVARPLFLALSGYERIVNATRFLETFRSNIFGVLRKRVPL